MLKIVADENIIFAKEAFTTLGNVRLIPGREISFKDLSDADVLLIRSITNVNEELLKSTKIKFVGTATIGNDHVDIDYLNSNNIAFANAAGCNADAVAEYVFNAIVDIAVTHNFNLKDKSIGIIGVGNIGSRIARLAKSLEMKVIKNDPPLKRLTSREDYSDLEDSLKADIVTLHVPLNLDGIDKTFHLLDKNTLEQLKNGCILINASRGPVIDNTALERIIDKKNLTVVLDVWENEPEINKSLLKKTFLGTPHIAGYSYEGKVNGTVMIYNSLCKYLSINPEWNPPFSPPGNDQLELKTGLLENNLRDLFTTVYDIKNDDKEMRRLLNLEKPEDEKYFDSMRKSYRLRREFTNFKVKILNDYPEAENILRSFRFQIT